MFARVAFVFVLSAAVIHAQGRPRKIFISVDMEGISGVVQPAQLGPDGFEYQRAREWMTGEVNAAITGIRASGTADVVVCDSHGNGQNILIDKLPDDVRIVRGFPRPLEMMQGIDDSFAGAMWAVLMAGMMLPSASPLLLLYGAMARRSDGNEAAAARRIHALAAGYLTVWTLFSLGATALQRVMGELLLVSSMMEVTGPRV